MKKAVQYGERQRPELRSRDPLIGAQVADAPRTLRWQPLNERTFNEDQSNSNIVHGPAARAERRAMRFRSGSAAARLRSVRQQGAQGLGSSGRRRRHHQK